MWPVSVYICYDAGSAGLILQVLMGLLFSSIEPTTTSNAVGKLTKIIEDVKIPSHRPQPNGCSNQRIYT